MNRRSNGFPTITGATTVSFGESLLRKADIELLQGPRWLNDTIIAFYFEYLENEVFSKCKHLLCVPPQVTQCIKISSDNEMGVFLEPLNARKKSLILFALNDHEFCETSGGSHWSLLVFSKEESVVYHYDSLKGSNKDQAMELGEKVLKYFGLPAQNFVEASCLQQSNSYDCGVHLLCNAEHIIHYFSKHETLEGCPYVNEDFVANFRGRMLKIILKILSKSLGSQ